MPTEIAPQTFIEKYDLGKRHAVYRAYRGLATAWTVFGLGVALELVNIYAVVIEKAILAFLVCYPIFILGLGWRMITQARQRDIQEIHLHENGLVHKTKETLVPMRWQDVDSVWQKITWTERKSFYNYRLQLHNGNAITLADEVRGIAELGQTILTETTKHIVPRLLDTLDQQGVIVMGPLIINRKGLAEGELLYTWDDIQAVQIADGVIVVQVAGRWLDWPKTRSSDIPNILAFLALMNILIAQNLSQARVEAKV